MRAAFTYAQSTEGIANVRFAPRIISMTRCLAVGLMAIFLGAFCARAQSPDDSYLRIYFLIQEGDTLLEQSRPSEALPKYLEARQALDRFVKGYPEWNPDVIKFRAGYVASRVADLESRLATRATTPTATVSPGRTNAPAVAVQQAEQPAPANALLEAQLTALRNDISQLRSDNADLQAKLKEALSAQPAVSDPKELEKAEERIRNLQKENELLKVSLSESQDPSRRADTNALARTQKALDDAKKELDRQREALAAANKSNTDLEDRLKRSAEQAQFASGLRTENELLKKQLTELQSAATEAGNISQEMNKLRLEVAALRSDKDVLENEKRALEERVRSRPAEPAPAPAAPEPTLTRKERKAQEAALKASEERIKKLERERNDLQKKLESANKQLTARKTKGNAARVLELERQLADMRDRLGPLEAEKVPYSEAELALLSVPGVNAPSTTNLRPVNNNSAAADAALSATTTSLISDARRHFAAREFDSAADKFGQAVQADQENVPALGGLAIAEMERNRLDEAEKAIRKAITLAPDNASAHSTLGQIKFRQKQFDAAFEALSRGASLDPNNAEIQNLLGVTLSQKGLRGPAEAALRKAIQLQPGYASAHNNLAIIYANAQPPLLELARWHYQKAIASGHARSSDMEAMLAKPKQAR